jgi:hypothetical protein
LLVIASYLNANVTQLLEPNKCEGWQWIQWDKLERLAKEQHDGKGEETLFNPMVGFVAQRNGFNPYTTLLKAEAEKQ